MVVSRWLFHDGCLQRDRLLQGRDVAEERADAAEEQIHSMATEYRQLLQDKQQEIDTLKLTVAQVRAKMDDQVRKIRSR
jgi:hypothetical protein